MKNYASFILICTGLLFACKQEEKKSESETKAAAVKAVGITIPDSSIKKKVIELTGANAPKVIRAGKPEIRPYSLDADAGNLNTTKLDASDGLSEDGYSHLLQTKNGMLWMATYQKLFRYDGNSIVAYSPIEGGLYPNQIMEDSHGSIWVSSLKGLFKFDGKTFVRITAMDSLAKEERDYPVSIVEDDKGYLWVANFRRGLFKLKDGILIDHFTTKDGLASDYILSITKDKAGRIWISHRSDSLSRYDGKNFTIISLATGFSRNWINNLLEDNKGNIWFRGGDGIFRYDGEKTEKIITSDSITYLTVIGMIEDTNGNIWFAHRGGGLSKYDGEQMINFKESQGLASNNIEKVTEGVDGNIWIGSVGYIERIDNTSRTFKNIYSGRNNENVGRNNIYGRIRSFLQDSKGNYWIGSVSNGISKYDGKTLANYSTPQGLTGTNIGSIVEDKEGNIWLTPMGIQEKEHDIIKFDGQNFTNYSRASFGLDPRSIIISSLKDRAGNLWFATMGSRISSGSISKFDGQTVTHYDLLKSLPDRSLSIRTIMEDSRGNIWMGVTDYGAICFDGTSFTVYNTKSGLADSSVYAIAEDVYGNMWFGTDKGLTRFYGRYINNYPIGTNDEEPRVTNIVKDSINDVFWLRTSAGLKTLVLAANHPDSISFENYSPKAGFNIGKSWEMFVDNNGIIWYSGLDNELRIFDYARLKAGRRAFDLHVKSVSLNNEKVIWNNLLQKSSGDKMYDSLVLATEMQTIFGKKIPELELKKMLVQFKGVRFDSITPLDPVPVNLVLPYRINSIRFEFAAIDPHFSKYTQYQYKLEGLTESWSELNKSTAVDFNNLREGKYTLQIKALNPYGLWSETSFSFRVLPPWYRTWWAYGLYVLLFLGALRIFSKWRERRLQHEKEMLQVKVEERTSELKKSLDDLKATQTQLIQSEKMASLGELTAGIAHEIQNPLNFVNNFSEINSELIEEQKEELEKGNITEAKDLANELAENEKKIIFHGKRADAIVKGMLQHSRNSSGQKELTDINALCDEYLRLAYHGIRAKDKLFNAKFETQFDESLPKIDVVPQDIGRVVLNLINNAFYAVNEKLNTERLTQNAEGYEPTVVISTKKEGGKVVISVKDNGNGIPASVKEKIFQPFFTTKPTGQGTGLGLSLSYDIVKAHGGELKVDTKEGEGSTFIIQIPTN